MYQEGGGFGGTAIQLGRMSTLSECIKKALADVPEANGVTFSATDCEARTGQLYVAAATDKHNCFINPKLDQC